MFHFHKKNNPIKKNLYRPATALGAVLQATSGPEIDERTFALKAGSFDAVAEMHLEPRWQRARVSR